MKIELFVLSLVTLLSTACKKDVITEEAIVQPSKTENTSAANSFSVSNWNTIDSWTTMQNGKSTYFEHGISASDISDASLKNGVFFVFLKFESYDSVLRDRPFSLPTIFIPNERYAASTIWSYDIQPGMLDVQYALDKQIDLGMNPQVQVRYFWVSNNFMEARHVSAPDLKKLSYNQLIALLGITQ
jgi:hypothetical protein